MCATTWSGLSGIPLIHRPVSAAPKKGEKRGRSSSVQADSAPERVLPTATSSTAESSRGPSVTFDVRPPVIRKTTRASPPASRAEPSMQREPPRGAISMVESILEQQARHLFGTSRTLELLNIETWTFTSLCVQKTSLTRIPPR